MTLTPKPAKLAFLTAPEHGTTLLNVQTDDGTVARYRITDDQLALIVADGIMEMVDSRVRGKRS